MVAMACTRNLLTQISRMPASTAPARETGRFEERAPRRPLSARPLGGRAPPLSDNRMEQDVGDERVGSAPGMESGATGGTRSQHVMVMGAMEPRTVQAALRPGVERARSGGAPSAPACLVVTPSAVATALAAGEARALLDSASRRVVPVTAVARGKRVLAAGPVAVAVGTPADLRALRRASALSLDEVQAVVLLGLDALLADGVRDDLEALLGDLPAGAVRVASSATDTSTDVTSFVERHLPKARHITPLVKASTASFNVTPHYVITTPAARASVLRTFLDERDPPSLAIITDSDVAEAEAVDALAQLGLRADGRVVQVVRGAPLGHTAAVVGWSMPATSEALAQALAGQPVDALFLIQSTDVPAMTAVSGGAARPLALAAAEAAASRGADAIHAAMRAALGELRTVGAADLALVAPLLDEFDPVEVAAAALRLFDDARRTLASAHGREAANRAVFAAPARAAAAESTGGGGMVRVFFNVGKRDNVRPGDLLGAIAGESGLPGDRIGSIDLFESHTLVEIAAEGVDTVIAKLTGVTVRGRQLHVRRDDRGAGGHAGFAGARGGTSDRGSDRRSADRGSSGRGFDRGQRGGDRGAARGGKSWEERGETRGGPARGRGEFRGGSDRGGPDRGGSDRGPARGGERPRGGERGGFDRGSRGPSARSDAARRAFGDRAPSERTEPRREWASRGEQLSRATRPRPDDRERGSGGDRPPLPFRRRRENDDA